MGGLREADKLNLRMSLEGISECRKIQINLGLPLAGIHAGVVLEVQSVLVLDFHRYDLTHFAADR